MNYDLFELNKFSQMAKDWWDKEHGSFKLIHLLNPLRVQYIEQQVGWLQGKKILDVGCGAGILCEKLSQSKAIVTGIDLAEQVILIAREHATSSGLDINYQLESAEQHEFNHQQYYDVICCMEMLEHVPYPEKIIKSISNMLKPGGILIISTINRNFKAHLFLITLAENILKWLPANTHNSAKFIKPYQLIKPAQNYGLQAVDIKGYHYNPISKSFWLNQDVSVNYFLTFRKSILHKI